MKIVAFNGSPRGTGGNTHVMVEEFLKGAEKAGAETENILLTKKEIKHCQGCFGCWLKTPGKCVLDDDLEVLRAKFLESDIVVFATPLYLSNFTGLMKNFLDRLYLPFLDPHIKMDEKGETAHPLRYAKFPKYVFISNCGFAEQTQFELLSRLFREIVESDDEILAEIYRGEGGLLTVKEEAFQPILSNYKELLRKAGKEIVENRKLSEETASELEKPLIPYDMFLKISNKTLDEL
ncbi:MAG: flavodoxin family protein [Methanosarcinaceae archaeon]|nr:flavodoxin family protein [Methanosarcinaceae archaeon]